MQVMEEGRVLGIQSRTVDRAIVGCVVPGQRNHGVNFVDNEETVINLLSQKPRATLMSMCMNIQHINVRTCMCTYIHTYMHT